MEFVQYLPPAKIAAPETFLEWITFTCMAMAPPDEIPDTVMLVESTLYFPAY